MLKPLLSITCGLALLTATIAQPSNFGTNYKALKARCIGPSGMSGRITTIDALHNDPNTIYLGAASGGVWKTTNAGNSWQPIFDEQPIQNIGSIAVCQSNPSIVWVGTGEGNPRNSVNIGEGIYKSNDAGKTWQCMGLEKTRNIHRVIIDPTNPNIVYAGAIGNPYGIHPERGVYKTTNGGETWDNVLHTNDTSGVADMVIDPKNPNKLFAAMWQHSRSPYSLNSGGKGSGLYVTYNAGKTWKNLAGEGGLPKMPYGRIGITICHDMPNRVYALIESTKSALYRSDDGGNIWEKVNEDPAYTANRSFYFQDVIADPQNENRLWLINQIVSVSEDGGRTFKTVIPYNGIHPDHHAFWIHPNNANYIIDGNDGGIGISRDKGKTWVFDEKLPVGQFYHISVDNALPYHVMGGMQDNGSWRGPAYTWTQGGLKNYYWESLWGGDGFDVLPDPEQPDWVYAMSQGGSLGRYNIVTGEDWNIKPPSVTNTVNKSRLRFNWNAAIAQDPFDTKTIYYGSQFVHKSTNKGASWTTISTDLSTNDSAKIDQSKNGGISIDITGAENHCTILAIAPSKLNKNILWVTTDDGNVQLTRNGGTTWTNLSPNITGLPKGCWLPQVQASRYNEAEAFVVANDYRRGNFAPMIYKTTNYGVTWVNILAGKSIKGYALCVLQDPKAPNLLYVGTEQGLWISVNGGNTYEQFKNNYPSVSTYDIALQERENDLCIATFGRAIYIIDDISALRQMANANTFAKGKKIIALPNNDAYQVTYKNAPGYEWSTWGVWDADNKPRGAALNFYVHFANALASAKNDTTAKAFTNSKKIVSSLATTTDQMGDTTSKAFTKNNKKMEATANTTQADTTKKGIAKSPKADSVQVAIYNSTNLNIRNLKWAVDTGLNRKYWNMDEKGYRYPGSPKPKPGANEPSGLQVSPGTYKVVYTYAGAKDSSTVTVKADPRNENNITVRNAQKMMLLTLRPPTDKLTLGMDNLTDAEDIIKKYEAQYKDVEGKEPDTIRSQNKKLLADIKTIREYISGKKIERQGYGQLPEETVLAALQEATYGILGKEAMPNEQDQLLVNKANKNMELAIEKINNFFATKWKAYKQLVEGTKVSLFKDVPNL